MNKPPYIGLTGGIGAGKSTVAHVFRSLGIPVYLADDRAKWLTANDELIRSKVSKHFGTAAFQEEGTLNRSYLAKQIFNDPEKARLLESWVHPAVARDFENWARQHQDKPYLLKEAALLFEAESHKNLDWIIVVTAPDELRIRRVLSRDPHRDEAQVKAIIEKQIPQHVKAANADFVIQNDEKNMIIPQVLRVHAALLQKTE